MRFVDHYRFCEPVGIKATAETVFNKIYTFFDKGGINWSVVTVRNAHPLPLMDGATAMLGPRKVAVTRIKHVFPDCVSMHCMVGRGNWMTTSVFCPHPTHYVGKKLN